MDTWLPQLEPARAHAGVPRVGGLPFGFPANLWPRCRRCHAPMAMLLQLPHSAALFDLGGDGRMLYAFQCADLDRQGCAAFGPHDGGNACFVLEATEQTGAVAPAPPSAAEIGYGWTLGKWRRIEDLNEDPDDLDEGDENPPSSQTKAGGAPFWIQEDETPEGPWRFLFQLETSDDSLSGWIGIANAGIASVFVRSDGAAEARLVWQDS